MGDIWFEHLSETLSGQGFAAYLWDSGSDRFEWAGNVAALFGPGEDHKPSDSLQFQRMINPQYLPKRLAAFHEMMSQQAVGDDRPRMKAVYKMRCPSGTQIDVEESATMDTSAQGIHLVRGFIRILEAEQLNHDNQKPSENLKFISSDRGMPHHGRTQLSQRLDEWQSTRRDNGEGRLSAGYLLVIGVDRLSMFNETFGPRYADEILDNVYQRLTQIAGKNASVCRIDGDVFGMFFPLAPHNEMASVGRYILNNFFDRPLMSSRGPVGVSISIGGMQLDPLQKAEPANFLVKAEMAMREAKNQGRGCYVSYQEAADRTTSSRFLLSAGEQFMQALKENRVKLAFQPIMSAKSRDASFHECLIRMIDGNGKMQSAGQFYPAIEKLGLSRLVDQFALRTAINELSLFPNLNLSVNVSNVTLMNRDWLRGIVLALRDHPSVANRLIVEVTESAVIDNPRQVTAIVDTLRDLGCRVALDDFGAGYTAFSQIKNLDLDIVKIDKSYVRGMADETNHLFVKTLQSLADGVNVETVAEGAETMGEADMLALDGVDYIQGYIYGFPQVERVWLPKEHTHRYILKADSETCPSDFEESLNQDLASFAR